jgi:GNAT superfamily N-acetyltransferase
MQTQTITITNTTAEHVAALAALQPIVFPTLHPDEHLKVEHFMNHLRLFPEGQFVALVDGVPVASTSTMRINFDFAHPQHSFLDIIDHGWLSGHNPNGAWLYGADMNVHPDYRRLGIGRQLYTARTALIERLNLRGQIAGGMLPGYVQHADRMTIQTYCQKVVAGELSDPTLTAQLKNGFRFVAVLYDYFVNANGVYKAAALIVKDNPMYMPLAA